MQQRGSGQGGSGHGTSEQVLLSLALVVALVAVAASLGSLVHSVLAHISSWAANLATPR